MHSFAWPVESFPPEVKTPFVTSFRGQDASRKVSRKRKAVLKSPYFAHLSILVKTGFCECRTCRRVTVARNLRAQRRIFQASVAEFVRIRRGRCVWVRSLTSSASAHRPPGTYGVHRTAAGSGVVFRETRRALIRT